MRSTNLPPAQFRSRGRKRGEFFTAQRGQCVWVLEPSVAGCMTRNVSERHVCADRFVQVRRRSKDVDLWPGKREETWRMANEHAIRRNKGSAPDGVIRSARDNARTCRWTAFNIKRLVQRGRPTLARFRPNNANYMDSAHPVQVGAGVLMASRVGCRPTPARDIRADRGQLVPAWSRYPPSCSAAPESRVPVVSPKTRRRCSSKKVPIDQCGRKVLVHRRS